MLVIKEIIVEAFPKIRDGIPRFLRICLFRESHVTMYLIGGSGSPKRKASGILPKLKRSSKPFLIAVTKAAA